MEVPSIGSWYSNCSNITMEDVHQLVLMRAVTGIVCFFLCLTSFVLEIIRIRCLKKESTVLQRFFIYVIISNLLRAAFLSMDIISHRNSLNVNRYFCEMIGFFSQYFASFQLLTITAMMFLLFHNLFTLNRKYKTLSSTFFARLPYLDVAVIVVLFVIPSLFTWIPFVIDDGLYGDAGPWCWLKAFDSNCKEINAVFILESVFWNVPFGIVLLFCLICVTIYLSFFAYISLCRKVSRKRLAPILVNTCVLFLFFAIYSSLCLVEMSALMFVHIKKSESSYSWLVLYAVTLPVGEISLSLSSFVHLFRLLCKSDVKPNRYYRASKLGRVIEQSSRVSAASYTSQQKRPIFVSPSTSEWTFPDNSANYGATDS